MAYKVRNGKAVRDYKINPATGKPWKDDGRFVVSTGKDEFGGWWWTLGHVRGRKRLDPSAMRGGPFRTEDEAYADAEKTILGPQCEVRHVHVNPPSPSTH